MADRSSLVGLFRPGSVRLRAALLAAAVVFVILALAVTLVLLVHRGQLLAGVDETLRQQVVDRATLLDSRNPPGKLVGVVRDEAFVWVGTPDGEQVAIGGDLRPASPPLPVALDSVEKVRLIVDEVDVSGEFEREQVELRVAAAATSDGALLVVAGADVESLEGSVERLALIFLITVPLLAAATGIATWFIAGRVLRPVEAIRSRAAEITGASLDARVPVPSGASELSGLAETMNGMLDRIESHDRSLRQFSSDASHELKSPVANLRALVDTSELDDPDWAPLREQLGGETDRLRDLVDNLLFVSAAGERPTAPTERVELDELLFAEAEMVAATGQVAVDLAGVGPAAVDGAPSELRRLTRNLVDNARRHASSQVWLRCGEGPSGAWLAVDDDGPGIAVEDRERVFERFTRLDDARARTDGGAGLGLSIVAEVARRHGAELDVGESGAGGASFTVRFR